MMDINALQQLPEIEPLHAGELDAGLDKIIDPCTMTCSSSCTATCGPASCGWTSVSPA